MTIDEAKEILEEIKLNDDCLTQYIAGFDEALDMAIKVLEKEPQTGHCKNCKWWKDSDGLYRRGGHAESRCPINRREVFEGSGYCYMFEPPEDKE